MRDLLSDLPVNKQQLNKIVKTSNSSTINLIVATKMKLKEKFYFNALDKRAPLYNGLPMTPSVIEDDQPLVDVLPLSLRRIESAWQEEVNTTKRERGMGSTSLEIIY